MAGRRVDLHFGSSGSEDPQPRTHIMLIQLHTDKTVKEAAEALHIAVEAHHFGVMQVHDLRETMWKKGVELAHECLIFEVCQPQQAARVLEADMALNMALPCRISVYTEAGQTKIGMVSPVAMLTALSSDPQLQMVAADVEATTRAIIDSAAAAGRPA